MTGWIKLHRELLDKPIWILSTPEQRVILITILLMVNHEEKSWEWKGEKYVCQPGQVVTSLDKIAKISGKGVSIQNVRTALLRFEKYEFLTNESTKQNRLITICNWEQYQENEILPNKGTNNQLTDDQQTPNKRLTTNKNDKNDKNNIKEKYDLNDDMAEVVYDWFEYKKERKESYNSQRGVIAFITKLKKLSGGNVMTAREIIEQSFANNWAGIFELKVNSKQQQHETKRYQKLR